MTGTLEQLSTKKRKVTKRQVFFLAYPQKGVSFLGFADNLDPLVTTRIVAMQKVSKKVWEFETTNSKYRLIEK